MTWNLGVIGCGNMSYALLKGICRSEQLAPEKIFVNDLDEMRQRLFTEEFKAISSEKRDLITAADLIILGVKPNQIHEVLIDTQNCWQENKLLLSIAAGVRTSLLEDLLQPNVPRVIRAMPNTPCLVGAGMIGLCAGSLATAADLEKVQSLFNASGRTMIFKEEEMDAVVAVSGSGPAYLFLMVEAMIEAAVNIGLSSTVARELVLQTVKGSVAMLEDSGAHPAVLKQQVTSPGGTTIAALRQLEEAGLRSAFFAAIQAAWERSKELG